MKILFITTEFPYPANTGGKIKTYNLLENLKTKHDCHIISLGKNTLNITNIENIRVLNVYNQNKYISYLFAVIAILRIKSPQIYSYFNIRMALQIRKLLSNNYYDFVFFDSIYSIIYINQIKSDKYKIIASPSDAFSNAYYRKSSIQSNIFMRIYFKISGDLISKFESKYYPKFNVVHLVSEIDKEYLTQITKANFEVIPISVSDEFIRENKRNTYNMNKILIVGDLREKGIFDGVVEFFNEILPFIKEINSNIEILVIGRIVTKKLDKYKNENVKIVAWVDDYKRELDNADVFISLDKTGTGLKNRVLQAFASRKLVLANDIALEGFKLGENCLSRVNTVEECQQRYESFFHDSSLQELVIEQNYKMVNESYTTKNVNKKWNELFNYLERDNL